MAVLVAVADVVAEHLALDAQLAVHGQVGEMQRHERLQVLGVQQLAVVRVVLQREAAADAVVLDLADFAGVLLFLERCEERGRKKRISKELRRHTQTTVGREMVEKRYLVGAVERDDVGLHLGLSLFWDAFIGAGRLNKKNKVRRKPKCFDVAPLV